MKKDCIVFAASIFEDNRIYILEDFLKAFSFFNDFDLFVGINYGSLEQSESIILKYRPDAKIVRLEDQEMYSHSDASAYQIALKLIHDSYRHYWFVHTKGGVHPHSDYLRNWYIENFLGKKDEISKFLEDNPYIGSYAKLATINDKAYEKIASNDVEIPLASNKIDSDLISTFVRFFYIHTLYVITEKPMNVFFKRISEKWFSTPLDTFYFEGVFPMISSRTGMYPFISNRYTNDKTQSQDLTKRISEWIDENELTQYKNKIQFKSDFYFDQLKPPM